MRVERVEVMVERARGGREAFRVELVSFSRDAGELVVRSAYLGRGYRVECVAVVSGDAEVLARYADSGAVPERVAVALARISEAAARELSEGGREEVYGG